MQKLLSEFAFNLLMNRNRSGDGTHGSGFLSIIYSTVLASLTSIWQQWRCGVAFVLIFRKLSSAHDLTVMNHLDNIIHAAWWVCTNYCFVLCFHLLHTNMYSTKSQKRASYKMTSPSTLLVLLQRKRKRKTCGCFPVAGWAWRQSVCYGGGLSYCDFLEGFMGAFSCDSRRYFKSKKTLKIRDKETRQSLSAPAQLAI